MNVRVTQGKPGYTYHHIAEQNLAVLKELQRQYEAMAYRTWFDVVDRCNPKWVLTVEKIKI